MRTMADDVPELSGPTLRVRDLMNAGRELTSRLARALGTAPDVAEATMQAVFQVISETVSEGQIDEVRRQLPEQMRYLFPALVA